jgi:hypothetical protein
MSKVAHYESFDWAFHQLMPEVPLEAIVYSVDVGEPDDPNVVLKAVVFEGDLEPTGAILDGPWEKIIAKEYLAQMAEDPARREK